jgi:hypothetical protein
MKKGRIRKLYSQVEGLLPMEIISGEKMMKEKSNNDKTM